MTRGPAKNLKCVCGTCKRCKDRLRCQAKKDGTWVPYKPQGKTAVNLAKAKKKEKEKLAEKAAWEKTFARGNKNAARAIRGRRSFAFKKNVKRFGLDKAKVIASVITRKRKRLFCPTEKSEKRYDRWAESVLAATSASSGPD